MSDDAQRELREVQAYFRLPGLGLVEKDLHVVRAIAALAAIDAAPFALVFGGGTALARAHRIIRRMSEDVDFKIVPAAGSTGEPQSIVRQQLGALRDRITANAAGRWLCLRSEGPGPHQVAEREPLHGLAAAL